MTSRRSGFWDPVGEPILWPQFGPNCRGPDSRDPGMRHNDRTQFPGSPDGPRFGLHHRFSYRAQPTEKVKGTLRIHTNKNREGQGHRFSLWCLAGWPILGSDLDLFIRFDI
jgi:hypothetical protein